MATATEQAPGIRGTDAKSCVPTLTQYKKYEGTITLSGVEKIFISNYLLEEKLSQIGFTNVVVEGTGSVRRASGVWKKETQPIVELPKQVTELKEV